jgi:hypothetical protein
MPSRRCVSRLNGQVQRRNMPSVDIWLSIPTTLEADWEKALRKLETAKAELALCEQQWSRTPRDGDQS